MDDGSGEGRKWAASFWRREVGGDISVGLLKWREKEEREGREDLEEGLLMRN